MEASRLDGWEEEWVVLVGVPEKLVGGRVGEYLQGADNAEANSQKTNNWFVCQCPATTTATPTPTPSEDDDGINDPLTLTTNMPSAEREESREEWEELPDGRRSIHLASIGLKSIGLRVDAGESSPGLQLRHSNAPSKC